LGFNFLLGLRVERAQVLVCVRVPLVEHVVHTEGRVADHLPDYPVFPGKLSLQSLDLGSQGSVLSCGQKLIFVRLYQMLPSVAQVHIPFPLRRFRSPRRRRLSKKGALGVGYSLGGKQRGDCLLGRGLAGQVVIRLQYYNLGRCRSHAVIP
jgi:hypothetical protein